jgi:hypothetical protein
MVEFGGATREEARARAQAALARFTGVLIEDRARMARFWSIRETALRRPRSRLAPRRETRWWAGRTRRSTRCASATTCASSAAWSTASAIAPRSTATFGDGCVHARIDFDLKSSKGIAHWRGFIAEAAALVVKYGGSLSGRARRRPGRAPNSCR